MQPYTTNTTLGYSSTLWWHVIHAFNLIFFSGSFPCLKVVFHFRRLFGYYLLQAYMPSFMIVILSWVSFWVHKEAVPARITLGVTTVLTMTTQLTSSSSNQINVSYAKAIDIWYAFCMILVFSALIEYAFVNSWSRLESKKEEKKTRKKNIIQDMTVVVSTLFLVIPSSIKTE